MEKGVGVAKKILRAYCLKKMKEQGSHARRLKSRRIAAKLFRLAGFRRAGIVCFYAALAGEVDTLFMIDRAIRMGKRVAVPLVDLENKELELFEIKDRAADLKKGAFGIWEPRRRRTMLVRPRSVDLVIVPGVAFDRSRNRLGRGLGFYDRFLKRLKRSTPAVGLAFSFQVVSKVPVESHDQKLDKILTEI